MQWPKKKLWKRPGSDGQTKIPTPENIDSYDDTPETKKVPDTVDTVRKGEISESIKALSDNLASVKKEYDVAVGNLLDVKKELAAKRHESASANALCDELQRRSTALDSQIHKSEEHHAEVRVSVQSSKDAAKELARINVELDAGQKKLERARKDLGAATVEVDAARKQHDDIKAQIAESARMLDKSRIVVKESAKSKLKSQDSDILKTASSMVASLNDKIGEANKEIAVLRGVIDKERREHAQTRDKLAKLERKNQR